MEVTVDSAGRILIPKAILQSVGLAPGSTVDISFDGPCVQITPSSRTARLVRDSDGRLVARSDTVVTDDQMLALIESVRR